MLASLSLGTDPVNLRPRPLMEAAVRHQVVILVSPLEAILCGMPQS